MGEVLWGGEGSAAKHMFTCDRPGFPNSWGPVRYFPQLLLATWTLVWERMLKDAEPGTGGQGNSQDFLDPIHV